MTKEIQKKLSESKSARWTVLVLVSFLMLCGYFISDVVAPLKPLLESQMGWSSENYGLFTSAYGWFNIFLFMLIFGGMILDKFGVRITGVGSALLMVIGTYLKYLALSIPELAEKSITIFGTDFTQQLFYASIGFAIFGVGVEVAGITVSKIIVKWFRGKELATAMGLQVACARIGTGLAMLLSAKIATWMGSNGIPSLSAPVYWGLMLIIIGFLVFFVFVAMDAKRDKQDADTSEPEEPFRFTDILDIIKIKAFWYIAILCVLFYSAVFPFLKYATDLMVNKFGVEGDLAGAIPSFLPFGTILLTPIFGSIYDRKGKGASIMILGSAMLIVIHFLFALPFVTWWVFALLLVILLGVSFSLVPSAMWPSLTKIVPDNKLGTAYALIFWIQNWGLSGVPLLIGWVLSKYCITSAPGAAVTTYNYTLPMMIFTALGVLAIFVAFLLKKEDKAKGYGIEDANIKK